MLVAFSILLCFSQVWVTFLSISPLAWDWCRLSHVTCFLRRTTCYIQSTWTTSCSRHQRLDSEGPDLGVREGLAEWHYLVVWLLKTVWIEKESEVKLCYHGYFRCQST